MWRRAPTDALRILKIVFLLLLFSIAPAECLSQRTFRSEQLIEDFDYLWSKLKDNYAYFDKKQANWDAVRELYRPRFGRITNEREFVTLLERVLDELYDPHTHLKTNTPASTRLIPTGLDVWAEWENGEAKITQLRSGFSAEQAGLRPGMVIKTINGVPVEKAIESRLGIALRKPTTDAQSWALRALLAGTHDTPRVIQAKGSNNVVATFRLDLPTHRTVNNYQADKEIEWKLLPVNFGYIKINNLGADETVRQFDTALVHLRRTRGLILDLRATQSGGNTSVAEPIMGRLIDRRMPYQKGQPVQGKAWTRYVSPRGWTYKAPVVVLVGRWTASMGEGIAIGLDAMNRATVVGTRMAGLNGAVFDLELPNTKIRLNYAAEKLFHINGTPREEFVPPVLVKLSATDRDETLQAGIDTLKRISTKSARTLRTTTR